MGHYEKALHRNAQTAARV